MSEKILNIYLDRFTDSNTSDLWIWWEGQVGRGFLLNECDYGCCCTVSVPYSVRTVGFIVRTNCSDPGKDYWGMAKKDYPEDRYIVLKEEKTDIYLVSGSSLQYTSSDGGRTLTEVRNILFASICSLDRIRFYVSPYARLKNIDSVRVSCGDIILNVKSVSSLNVCSGSGVITLAEELDMHKIYTVSIDGYGSLNAVPTDVFDTDSFEKKYNYSGDDLGVSFENNQVVFRLWAPTASTVILNLYHSGYGSDSFEHVSMEAGENGVWYVSCSCSEGVYYTYTVTTASGTKETADPYGKACGVNGERSMVVNLEKTNPQGFDKDRFIECHDYRDAVVWETHVRDFSSGIKNSNYKGKYLAFTEKGLRNTYGVECGIDWLKKMGITHVQLQPVFDYESVDERNPFQYNWGYDPENFNIPEGSYSTDPYNGEVRINEFKRMVQSLHSEGFGVIMDVVFNHTFLLDSVFSKTVPRYYYRYTSSGLPSNGSGCGNETASERYMFRKYILDSLRYWMNEYHIDGFRFDLMAVHDIETMQEVEKTVHAINPYALIYGEGWSGGSVLLNAGDQATQSNINRISFSGIGGVAVFNDVIRDGLKGSSFSSKSRGYINGAPDHENVNKVIFGLKGGTPTSGIWWSVRNSMVVNYMSSHDNYTLWDQIRNSAPGDISAGELLHINRFGAAIVFISSGMVFMLSGEEMLRTKNGDGNSYKSSDSVNSIKWEMLRKNSDQYKMSVYYRRLISMRRENLFIRRSDVSCEVISDNVIKVIYTENGVVQGLAYVNPNNSDFVFNIDNSSFTVVFCSEQYIFSESTIKISSKSVIILKKLF